MASTARCTAQLRSSLSRKQVNAYTTTRHMHPPSYMQLGCSLTSPRKISYFRTNEASPGAYTCPSSTLTRQIWTTRVVHSRSTLWLPGFPTVQSKMTNGRLELQKPPTMSSGIASPTKKVTGRQLCSQVDISRESEEANASICRRTTTRL